MQFQLTNMSLGFHWLAQWPKNTPKSYHCLSCTSG